MLLEKEKTYVSISECIYRLNVQERKSFADLIRICAEHEDAFRATKNPPPKRSFTINKSDLTRIKQYKHSPDAAASNVGKLKWEFLRYVLQKMDFLPDAASDEALSENVLYHHLVQQLHNGNYDKSADIRLYTGTYLLRRLSYLQQGMISTSKLEIEKLRVPGSADQSYYTYHETKRAAQGGRDVYTGAKGYIVRSLQNYILVGITKFSQTDPANRVTPEEDHFTDFTILKPSSNIQRLRGVTLGVIRDTWTPFATRVDVEYIGEADDTNVDAELGISKPTAEQLELITNEIDVDGWGVLLPQ